MTTLQFLLIFSAGALFGFALGVGIVSMLRVGKRADEAMNTRVASERGDNWLRVSSDSLQARAPHFTMKTPTKERTL